ncbi:hypothetical protein ACWDKQ_30185 [Saccharopolyspora sp. NPDC000995]
MASDDVCDFLISHAYDFKAFPLGRGGQPAVKLTTRDAGGGAGPSIPAQPQFGGLCTRSIFVTAVLFSNELFVQRATTGWRALGSSPH